MDNKSLVKKLEFFAGFVFMLVFAVSARPQSLTAVDVQTVIAQAVSKAAQLNKPVTVVVTDKEGHPLGTFVMTGAPASTLIRSVGRAGQGLENRSVPSTAAALSKAGTAGIFSTGGNAFTTRTAGFIIQQHFPPGIDNTEGGPLFGVQFSTLACSDVAIAGLPLGLSGDPGGVPLYKNGVAVGGVGIEGDGLYSVDLDPTDDDQPVEEIIAVSATRGFEAPPLIRADNILVGGIRFPYVNTVDTSVPTPIAFGSLPGAMIGMIIATPPSDFVPATLNGVSGQVSTRFPTIAGSALSAAEVSQVLGAAAETANRVRAAIRQPIGTNGRVTMAVVDTDGKVLGIFRQLDAPVFGFDVAVQKARSANFFSRVDAGAKLTLAGFAPYVNRANADGIQLNGSVAFSERGIGFLHRPLFPDGINGTDAGPLSTKILDFSPFNNGLQVDLIKNVLLSPPMVCASKSKSRKFSLVPVAACPCTAVPELKNGLQIFAGGIPLYRGSTLIGAIGVSGDGIDQDDLVAAAGANLFPPPAAIRSDTVVVRGARLPFVKFPVRPFVE